MIDIIIVGAGPVGLYAAGLCEKMGYKVAVLEEDKEIGKPLKCSGLVSENIKRFFPVIEAWGVIENEIGSATLHSRRSEMSLRKKKAAYVINRTLFDRHLSEMLETKIRLGCRARKIVLKGDHVEVVTNKGVFRGEMAALCNGPGSALAKAAPVVKGLIAIVDRPDMSDRVDLYFRKSLLRDGFFWKIPRGRRTEYGAWGADVRFGDIERYFGLKEYRKFAGLIPIGAAPRSYGERLLMIGGSAGQVKPWSGGGVIYGLTCAKIAGKVIEKAFRNNDFSASGLAEYEKLWKAKIGRQIKMGLAFRRFLKHSSDLQLDMAFGMGKLVDYRWMDMDFIV